jgi:hypothetical protein
MKLRGLLGIRSPEMLQRWLERGSPSRRNGFKVHVSSIHFSCPECGTRMTLAMNSKISP